jgi:translation initiation factor IF-3
VRINERIRVPQVRLIGPEGSQLGIMPIQKALSLANQHELDLVEVAPQEKKEREAKKHQMRTRLKEIRLKPNIDEHDYQVKLRQAIGFLNKKDKVKVSLFFRGRQMEHLDLGRKVLDRFINDAQQAGKIERDSALEGRIISAVLAPR